MSDPSNPPQNPGDDEETSDTGGDSDPGANEGFEPPDEGRNLATPA
ncbi:MAG: hypothetical protein JWO77_717 [Ilumatobacteraceae bacterium]|nr:hypothetical protein [Ilumatobacteraceae bacterium]